MARIKAGSERLDKSRQLVTSSFRKNHQGKAEVEKRKLGQKFGRKKSQKAQNTRPDYFLRFLCLFAAEASGLPSRSALGSFVVQPHSGFKSQVSGHGFHRVKNGWHIQFLQAAEVVRATGLPVAARRLVMAEPGCVVSPAPR